MRRADWNARLSAYIASTARQAFRPGQNDCALFAAGAVEAVTGVDPAADFRGQYRTLEDGHALIVEAGHADHVAYFASLFDEIAPHTARVGDLAVVMDGEHPAIGVVQGPSIYVLRLDGLGLVPLTDAERAFSV